VSSEKDLPLAARQMPSGKPAAGRMGWGRPHSGEGVRPAPAVR
jgi:hypothetical protein